MMRFNNTPSLMRLLTVPVGDTTDPDDLPNHVAMLICVRGRLVYGLAVGCIVERLLQKLLDNCAFRCSGAKPVCVMLEVDEHEGLKSGVYARKFEVRHKLMRETSGPVAEVRREVEAFVRACSHPRVLPFRLGLWADARNRQMLASLGYEARADGIIERFADRGSVGVRGVSTAERR